MKEFFKKEIVPIICIIVATFGLFVLYILMHYELKTVENVSTKIEEQVRAKMLEDKVRQVYRDFTGKELRVTSTYRTPRRQALAMHALYKKGVDLYSLYADKKLIKELDKFLESGNIEGTVEVIKSQVERGEYLSKHMCGKAIDIVLGYKSSLIMEYAKYNKDIEIIDEGNHYHIELKEDC